MEKLTNEIICQESYNCSLILTKTKNNKKQQVKAWKTVYERCPQKRPYLPTSNGIDHFVSVENDGQNYYNNPSTPRVGTHLQDVYVSALFASKPENQFKFPGEEQKMKSTISILNDELFKHFNNGEPKNESGTFRTNNPFRINIKEKVDELRNYDLKVLPDESTIKSNIPVRYNMTWDHSYGPKLADLNHALSPPRPTISYKNASGIYSTMQMSEPFSTTHQSSFVARSTTYKSTTVLNRDSSKHENKEKRALSKFYDLQPVTTQSFLCSLCTYATINRQSIKCPEPCDERPTPRSSMKNFSSEFGKENIKNFLKRSAHADFYPLGENTKSITKKCKIKAQKPKYYNINSLFPRISQAKRFRKKFTMWCCPEETTCKLTNIAKDSKLAAKNTDPVFDMKMESVPITTPKVIVIKPESVHVESSISQVSAISSALKEPSQVDKKKNYEARSINLKESSMNDRDHSYNITALMLPKNVVSRLNIELARQKRNLKIFSAPTEDKPRFREGNSVMDSPIFYTLKNDNGSTNNKGLAITNHKDSENKNDTFFLKNDQKQSNEEFSKISLIDLFPLDIIQKLILSPTQNELATVTNSTNLQYATKERDRIKTRSLLGQLLPSSAAKQNKIKDLKKPWELPWKEGDIDLQLINSNQTRKPAEIVPTINAQNSERTNLKIINEEQPICPTCGRKVSSFINKKIFSFNDQVKQQKINDSGPINQMNEDFAMIKVPASTSVPMIMDRFKILQDNYDDNIVTYTLNYAESGENQEDFGPSMKENPMMKIFHIIERPGSKPKYFMEIPDQLGELITESASFKIKSFKNESKKINMEKSAKGNIKSNDSVLVYVNPFDIDNEKLLVPLPEFYKLICSKAKQMMDIQHKLIEPELGPIVKLQDNEIRQFPMSRYQDHNIPLPPNPMPYALVPAYIPIKPPYNDLPQTHKSVSASTQRNDKKEEYASVPRSFDFLRSVNTATSRLPTFGFNWSSHSTVTSATKEANKSTNLIPKEIEASLINSILRMCTPESTDANTSKHNKVPLFMVMQDIVNDEPFLEFKKPTDEVAKLRESLSVVPIQNLKNVIPNNHTKTDSEKLKS